MPTSYEQYVAHLWKYDSHLFNTIPASPSRVILLLQIQFCWQKQGGVAIVPVVEDISVTVMTIDGIITINITVEKILG